MYRKTNLAIVGLEGLGDLQTLDDAATAEHVDDGLLVSAKALHGFAQGLCVRGRVERLRGKHRGGALWEKYFGKHLFINKAIRITHVNSFSLILCEWMTLWELYFEFIIFSYASWRRRGRACRRHERQEFSSFFKDQFHISAG